MDNKNMLKEYKWPDSFPDCTPASRAIVEKALKEEFIKESRAKCLIIIGPKGTGKTLFAKSLPGTYNYFNGEWKLNNYSDFAHYCIYDNIEWDQFEEKGFPYKKGILTQDGLLIATDASGIVKEINVQQPAIVLLNPGPKYEGSLTAQPHTYNQCQQAEFWKRRAIIYRMGPNEYFHKPSI